MIGTKLGPYEITGKLGEGGMGEVYRATDTKLHRDVAIKVLPAAFTEDKERLQRFEREAQLLAQLQHPNIASIYGMEESGSTRALVMELVEGPTLADRLAQGPLSIEEVLSIARQIAEALEEAHEKGIVHRDLKPQNIKASMEGKVKVLDFGLAKAMDPIGTASGAPSGSQLAASPTLTLGATVQGVILGTAAYMSPEQAKGLPVDKRADIWAFGVVLFEMLVGGTLFAGDTVGDTLAAVIRKNVELEKLPESTPAPLRRLLRRCLERNPKSRLHSIADARIVIDEVLSGRFDEETPSAAAQAAPTPAAWRRALPWVVAAIAVGFGAWSWIGGAASAPAALQVVASLPPPVGGAFLADRGFAISPDASRLVFAARDGGGADGLWIRSLRDGSVQRIAGTEGAARPFWSPDGHAVAFFAGPRVKIARLDQGIVEVAVVTDRGAGERQCGSWGPKGELLFSNRAGIFRATPGREGVELVAEAEDALEYLSPTFLPDGDHFLYLVRDYRGTDPKGELRIGALSGGTHRTILRTNSNAVYAPSGELVWWQEGNLRAQPFDLGTLELSGSSRLVRGNVRFDPRVGLGLFSVARDGTLVVLEGGVVAADELTLVDRSGRILDRIGEPGNFYHPRLSPDGTRIAVDRSDEANRGDIWIYDLERGTGTRWASATEDETSPVWSPDGRQVAYEVSENSQVVRIQSIGGAIEERDVLTRSDVDLWPMSWNRNGWMVVELEHDVADGPRFQMAFLSVADGKLVEAPVSRSNQVGGALSPDGRFLAFDSDETGRPEVYVQTFPDATDRWRISAEGGFGASWRSDGRELYFQNAASEIVAVPVRPATDGSTFAFGQPEILFPVQVKPSEKRQVDTLDGERFLVNHAIGAVDTTPLTLVVHGLSRADR